MTENDMHNREIEPSVIILGVIFVILLLVAVAGLLGIVNPV